MLIFVEFALNLKEIKIILSFINVKKGLNWSFSIMARGSISCSLQYGYERKLHTSLLIVLFLIKIPEVFLPKAKVYKKKIDKISLGTGSGY